VIDSEKLDVIIQEISGLKGDVQGLKGDVQGLKGDVQRLEDKIVSVEKLVLDRTDKLKEMDESILREVNRVHQIFDTKTKNLESKIG